MAVEYDFLGYEEEQCKFSFHSHYLSRIMYVDCFWLSLVTSSGKYIVGGGMFQEIHELSAIFLWHHLKNKTKHCCVICFIIWSSRLPERPIKRKLEWRGRAPIS